jgi:hypothetical protein
MFSQFTNPGISFAAALRGTAAASGTSNSSGRATRKIKIESSGSCTPARNRSVNSGYKCKQCASPQYVENSNRSTADYGFRTYIEHINLNLRIKEPNELDEVTQYSTTLVQEAAWYSTPTPKEERKKIDNIPFHIRELVTEKRRARSRWQRSRNDDRPIYNRLRQKLHNALTNAKNKTFEYYIASLSKDDHTI